jgi:hypothetical protein
MSRKRQTIVGVSVAALVAVNAVCGSSRDGPTQTICGFKIGRATHLAGSGPFDVDAAQHPPVAPIVAAAGSDSTHVRVSSDCAVGAKIVVSNRKVIAVQRESAAQDGADEVLSVVPLFAGRSTVTASRSGSKPIRIPFVVTPPVGAS